MRQYIGFVCVPLLALLLDVVASAALSASRCADVVRPSAGASGRSFVFVDAHTNGQSPPTGSPDPSAISCHQQRKRLLAPRLSKRNDGIDDRDAAASSAADDEAAQSTRQRRRAQVAKNALAFRQRRAERGVPPLDVVVQAYATLKRGLPLLADAPAAVRAEFRELVRRRSVFGQQSTAARQLRKLSQGAPESDSASASASSAAAARAAAEEAVEEEERARAAAAAEALEREMAAAREGNNRLWHIARGLAEKDGALAEDGRVLVTYEQLYGKRETADEGEGKGIAKGGAKQKPKTEQTRKGKGKTGEAGAQATAARKGRKTWRLQEIQARYYTHRKGREKLPEGPQLDEFMALKKDLTKYKRLVLMRKAMRDNGQGTSEKIEDEIRRCLVSINKLRDMALNWAIEDAVITAAEAEGMKLADDERQAAEQRGSVDEAAASPTPETSTPPNENSLSLYRGPESMRHPTSGLSATVKELGNIPKSRNILRGDVLKAGAGETLHDARGAVVAMGRALAASGGNRRYNSRLHIFPSQPLSAGPVIGFVPRRWR
jgi:hypothetical protein